MNFRATVQEVFKSQKTGLTYDLEWNIKVKNFIITTKPLIKDGEMRFGFINYWEGPVDTTINRKKAKGFMEYVAKQDYRLTKILENKIDSINKILKGGDKQWSSSAKKDIMFCQKKLDGISAARTKRV